MSRKIKIRLGDLLRDSNWVVNNTKISLLAKGQTDKTLRFVLCCTNHYGISVDITDFVRETIIVKLVHYTETVLYDIKFTGCKFIEIQHGDVINYMDTDDCMCFVYISFEDMKVTNHSDRWEYLDGGRGFNGFGK